MRDAVLAALSKVQDPDLGQDLVTLGMIRDLEVFPGGRVSLRVVLTTPACPLKAQIEADVRSALASAGVTDVSLKMDSEVKRAQPAMDGIQHIVAVSSGKGGVGKSTTAVNLAVGLALEGARVGLLDADLYGPNLPTMLGATEGPTLEVVGERERFVPPMVHGIKLMSIGFLVEKDQPMIWRGPMLHNVLNQFLGQVNWGTLDYLIIDMPPGTGDIQLSLAQLVPLTGAVLVTTPQEVAMEDVRKAYTMWDRVRVPVLGVVENMSTFVCNCGEEHSLFGQGGGVLLAKRFGVELLAQVPLVAAVREGGDSGRPVVLGGGPVVDKVASVFRKFAQRVAQLIEVRSHKGAQTAQQTSNTGHAGQTGHGHAGHRHSGGIEIGTFQ